MPRGSSAREISQARGRLAKMLHPDMRDGQSKALMQLINHAVEVLTSGQAGAYTFSTGAEETATRPGQPGEHSNGQQQNGQQQEACTHPRKAGYKQCFKCSGVMRCEICGEGYYKPPNDRCSACRRSAWGRP